MLVTIDVGNSDIVTIVYDHKQKILYKNRQALLVDDLKTNIKQLKLNEEYLNFDYIVACVVPKIKDQLEKELFRLFNKAGYFIDYLSYPEILENLLNPKELGADLLAVAVAASLTSDQPTIITDMGSATKIIVVVDGYIEGVSIMLGVRNTMLALNSQIKHLPQIDLKFPDKLVGNDTVSSLSSGLMYGNYFGTKAYVQAIETALNQKCRKVLTGGIANLFKDKLNDFEFIADLVNRGLFALYMKNIGDYDV